MEEIEIIRNLTRTITTPSGKRIWVYDNLFTNTEIDNFLQFFQKSCFRLGGLSIIDFNAVGHTFPQSTYSQADIDSLGLIKTPGYKLIENHFKNIELTRAWVIASNSGNMFHAHTDSRDIGDKTLLYYGNRKWDIDWGGETIFYDDRNDAIAVVSYKPGRVVIFDSEMTHRPANITPGASQYRFTLVHQYKQDTRSGRTV